MEGKKGNAGSTSSSIADELFGRKEAAGILGEVFQPPASGVERVGKEPQTPDLFESSKKQQATESQTWNAQSATADAKAQGSPSKGQTAPYKDRLMDLNSLPKRMMKMTRKIRTWLQGEIGGKDRFIIDGSCIVSSPFRWQGTLGEQYK
ncbi:hypothetical protein J5N97_002410 [Dioscorea zingiberensis]|uniref:Uncharacterized protein n=1 Tax=Dioscorea zingiberensis TaxID=325984 RepID=A0A9D5D3R4_9LILI|nr:hypothetical protein J5N97_002410 [Dioscorea zingiberensis]